jgi:hypothetical protein
MTTPPVWRVSRQCGHRAAWVVGLLSAGNPSRGTGTAARRNYAKDRFPSEKTIRCPAIMIQGMARYPKLAPRCSLSLAGAPRRVMNYVLGSISRDARSGWPQARPFAASAFDRVDRCRAVLSCPYFNYSAHRRPLIWSPGTARRFHTFSGFSAGSPNGAGDGNNEIALP